QAVTFDLWNTLIVDSGGGGRSRADRRIEATVAALRDCGRDYPLERVEEAYWASQRRFEQVRIRGLDTRFEVQLDDFLDTIEGGLARAIGPGPKELITSHHLNAYLEDPPTLMPGALDVLETLTGHGYKIGLICNSGTTPGSLQRKWLEEQGIVRYMKVLTFSDEVELAKPSSEIFFRTLRALGVRPHLSVHIGDRPETDILGAKRVGMRAILIGGESCDGVPVDPDARVRNLAELPAVLAAMEHD
ncbi:MAG: HAD family hydrolase, partial [Dehalococcoidia bacterium]